MFPPLPIDRGARNQVKGANALVPFLFPFFHVFFQTKSSGWWGAGGMVGKMGCKSSIVQGRLYQCSIYEAC